jgi:hypothetical protein
VWDPFRVVMWFGGVDVFRGRCLGVAPGYVYPRPFRAHDRLRGSLPGKPGRELALRQAQGAPFDFAQGW